MINKIDCLDKGYVRLIDSMGNDLSIIRSARVSYDAAWRTGEDEGSDIKLLNYLYKNKHTTPFESVTFTFEVKAPIFVLRQWHRHRTQSYNELSGRYKELPSEFYIPFVNNIGIQSKNNKQGRDTFTSPKTRLNELSLYIDHCEAAFNLYENLIESEWPKELARMVLPVSTYSHMFVTLNLLNLLKFLTLRCDPHAQYEIRVYAEALRDLAREIVPETIKAWETYK